MRAYSEAAKRRALRDCRLTLRSIDQRQRQPPKGGTMWVLIIVIYGAITGAIPFDTEAQCWRGAVYALQLEEAHERPLGAIEVRCERAA